MTLQGQRAPITVGVLFPSLERGAGHRGLVYQNCRDTWCSPDDNDPSQWPPLPLPQSQLIAHPPALPLPSLPLPSLLSRLPARHLPTRHGDHIMYRIIQPPSILQLVCVETVLTDEKKVWDNVKDAKLNSPDFKGMTPEEAMEVGLVKEQAMG